VSLMGHHHGFLADYSHLDGTVHRLPTGVKFSFALAMVAATLLTPLHIGGLFLANATAVLLVAMIAGIPPFFLVRRVVMLETFVVLASVLTLFQPGGGAVFASVIVRSSLSLCWMTLLANTTPFASLIDLLRRLRVPSLLVTTIALMYRYLFVLRDEAVRLKRARASRTFARRRRLSTAGLADVATVLLWRTHRRADRVYQAMCARGWT
jgi:cobalt/nickel transport system permease protein